MSTRRSFLQQTGIAAAISFLSPQILSAAWSRPNSSSLNDIGLQLFTLRTLLLQDPKSVLSKVAKIGYKNLETYYGYPGIYETKDFWGLNPKAFKLLLEEYNLTSSSGHYNTTAFLTPNGNEETLKNHIETAAIVGQRYFVIPGLPTNIRQAGTIDDYKQMADKFNQAGQLCKAQGLQLLYHNHNFEFKNFDNGTTGYQTLLKETDPSLVNFELDLFWAINAGIDPLNLFKENPGCFKAWHVKDMSKADKNTYTEVGTGSIDFKSIFSQAKTAGLEQIFIEQDVIQIDPYISVTQSFNYVKNMLLK